MSILKVIIRESVTPFMTNTDFIKTWRDSCCIVWEPQLYTLQDLQHASWCSQFLRYPVNIEACLQILGCAFLFKLRSKSCRRIGKFDWMKIWCRNSADEFREHFSEIYIQWRSLQNISLYCAESFKYELVESFTAVSHIITAQFVQSCWKFKVSQSLSGLFVLWIASLCLGKKEKVDKFLLKFNFLEPNVECNSHNSTEPQ
jgi:hypothetical protein